MESISNRLTESDLKKQAKKYVTKHFKGKDVYGDLICLCVRKRAVIQFKYGDEIDISKKVFTKSNEIEPVEFIFLIDEKAGERRIFSDTIDEIVASDSFSWFNVWITATEELNRMQKPGKVKIKGFNDSGYACIQHTIYAYPIRITKKGRTFDLKFKKSHYLDKAFKTGIDKAYLSMFEFYDGSCSYWYPRSMDILEKETEQVEGCVNEAVRYSFVVSTEIQADSDSLDEFDDESEQSNPYDQVNEKINEKVNEKVNEKHKRKNGW